MIVVSRDDLARRIVDEITLSDDPDAMLRKWRTDPDISQTALAEQLDVLPSVASDYESGCRGGPGIGVIRRMVEALLDIDEARGGSRIRQYAHVFSAGFKNGIAQDLREYPTSIPLNSFCGAIGAIPIVDGDQDRASGHTVINSIQVITRLSSEEFYRLYEQSTSRVPVFTGATHGEPLLVTMRVVTPTPNTVVLHGLSKDDLWEHAPTLATIDGFALAVIDRDSDETLEDLRKLP